VRKYAKPVLLGMARQINQDINSVRPDALGQVVVRQPDGHQPVTGIPPQPRRDSVRPRHFGITEYFYRLLVVAL
jgi:hypothetical protein